MAAMFSAQNQSNRCSMAVACTSAPVYPLLDTAIILVVSICVLCLRVIMPLA